MTMNLPRTQNIFIDLNATQTNIPLYIDVGDSELILITSFGDNTICLRGGMLVGQALTIQAKLSLTGTRFPANPSLLMTSERVNRDPSTSTNAPFIKGFFGLNGSSVDSVVVNPAIAYPAAGRPSGAIADPWIVTVFMQWTGTAWAVIGGLGLQDS